MGAILLILIGGVLLQAFITPPKKIGTYVTSSFEKVGSFYENEFSSSVHSLESMQKLCST